MRGQPKNNPCSLMLFSYFSSLRKLMLAKINWTLFINEEEKVQNLVDLVGVIKKEIADTDKAAAEESPAEEKDTDCENAYNTLYNHTPGVQLTSEAVNTSVADIKYDFWNCHFKNEEKVCTFKI